MASIINKIFKKALSATAQAIVKRYIRKDRKYFYKGLDLIVFKDVFHPAFFRSTKVFGEWLENQHISNKTLLELGCGSALLSLIAAKHGAIVTAIDINPKAVANAKINATKNNLAISTFVSDLFTDLPSVTYNLVLINPPYFPKNPINNYEHAWFCGNNFEYFYKLFIQIQGRNTSECYYMILSDACDLISIKEIAVKHALYLKVVYEKIVMGETFIIYQIIHV